MPVMMGDSFVFVAIFAILCLIVLSLRIFKKGGRRSLRSVAKNTTQRLANQRRGNHRHQRTSSLILFYSGLFAVFLALLTPFIRHMADGTLNDKGTVTVLILICLLLISIFVSILGRGLELNE